MPGRFQVYLAIPTPKIEFDKESLLLLKIDFLAIVSLNMLEIELSVFGLGWWFPLPKNSVRKENIWIKDPYGQLERVWVYFIWQLMTRWLLSQYCHYPLSRDSNNSNPCTTYTSIMNSQPIGMKVDISYDILMPVDDGSRLKKNLNLVVALTCFRLEGTELFPLLTGDKTAITISNHFSFVNTPSNQNPFSFPSFWMDGELWITLGGLSPDFSTKWARNEQKCA